MKKLLFIPILAFFGSSTCHSLPNTTSAITYRLAGQDLASGNYDLASKKLNTIISVPVLDSWVRINLTKAAIAKGDLKDIPRVLQPIPPKTAPSIYRDTLLLLLGSVNFQTTNETEIKKLEVEVNNFGYSDLLPVFPVVRAYQYFQEGNLVAAQKQIIASYSLFPSSPYTKFGYKLSRIIESKSLNPTDIQKTWTAELVALKNSSMFIEALDRVYSLRRRLTDQQALFSLGKLHFEILKAQGKKNETEQLLSEFESSGNQEYKNFAFLKRADDAWRRNDYANAEKYLAQIDPPSAESRFIRAKIDEENSRFELAITKYDGLIGTADTNISTLSANRSAFLKLYQNGCSDIFSPFKTARRLSSAEAEVQSLSFWLDQCLNKARVMQSDGYPSFYSLIEPGSKFERAQSISVEKSCNFQIAVPKIPKRVSMLASLGLFDLAEVEYRYFEPLGATPTSKAILARARALSDIGALGQAFKVLQDNRILFSEIYKSCPRETLSILFPRKYFDIITKQAGAQELDPLLLLAITRTESAFNPLAVSRANAYGLMQLIVPTARMEGLTDARPELLFNEETNIRFGAKHLKRHLDHFGGRLDLAIAAYNAGSNAVDKWLKRYPDADPEVFMELIPYPETRNYVKKVLFSWWMYRALRP